MLERIYNTFISFMSFYKDFRDEIQSTKEVNVKGVG
jgi:hypothetical protein